MLLFYILLKENFKQFKVVGGKFICLGERRRYYGYQINFSFTIYKKVIVNEICELAALKVFAPEAVLMRKSQKMFRVG